MDLNEHNGPEELEDMEEEMFETVDIEGDAEIEALTAQQASEMADFMKLYKQHPEIWIPYSDQVQERLLLKGHKDPHHTTYPLLTNYEKTKILSFRASQLANGADPYILVPEGVTSTDEIAALELKDKRLPFILKRPLPNGEYEYWRLVDLMLP
jgi:DNA-directed RNA polymerase subunit K/omega